MGLSESFLIRNEESDTDTTQFFLTETKKLLLSYPPLSNLVFCFFLFIFSDSFCKFNVMFIYISLNQMEADFANKEMSQFAAFFVWLSRDLSEGIVFNCSLY